MNAPIPPGLKPPGPPPSTAGGPDPSTPGPQPRQSALGAALTTAGAGTPASVLIILLLSKYAHVTDPTTISILSPFIASTAGYLWRVILAVLSREGVSLPPPPST